MTFFDAAFAERLYKIQFYTYLVGIYSLISLYILTVVISIFKIPYATNFQAYLDFLNLVIGMYCSLYLLWRYNTVADWLGLKSAPVEFTRLDRMVALHAGVLLFGMVILTKVQSGVIKTNPYFKTTKGVS